MPSFMFYSKDLQHIHHSVDSLPHFYKFEKVLFDVYVPFEVILQFDVFILSLQSKASIYIPISTCDKCKISFILDWQRLNPFIKILQSLLNRFSFFDHILGNPRQFSAKITQLWVKLRHNIPVKLPNLLSFLNIDGVNWELYDLRAGINFLIFDACSLKI